MDKYVIYGGSKLSGSIEIQSAKNSVLPILAGSILCDGEVIIKKCPKILDVLNMVKILKSLGVKADFYDNIIIVNSSSINKFEIPETLMSSLRSSVFTLGPMLAKYKRAVISYPGGCDIGLRPINLHLEGLKSLGVIVQETNGRIICDASEMRSGEVWFDYPSVGATENIMMASVFLDGETTIHNSAKEPEIVDLQNFINSMGGKVYGAGTSRITVVGVKQLHSTVYQPLFDRIEAGTYMIAAAITGGEIELKNCKSEKISSLIHKLQNNTCKITLNSDIINVRSLNTRKSFNIETAPYPGFPTDLQAQMLALSTICNGVSIIKETVFETRFRHATELIKMGAEISVCDRVAVVKGVKRLRGAPVTASDLRGGAALTLAALSAEGKTVLSGVEHIERGYYNFEQKLSSLGANVKKV